MVKRFTPGFACLLLLLCATFSGVARAETSTKTLAWSTPSAIPSLGSLLPTSFSGLSCLGTSCTAVGNADTGTTYAALISSGSGSRWQSSLLALPSPSDDATLASVSCSSQSCTAVGSVDVGGNLEALVATNATGSWVALELPNTIAGAQEEQLSSVSCTTTQCTAVGFSTNGSTQNSFIATNSSGQWVENPLTSDLPNSTSDQLTSVSCTSSACTAVGSYASLNQDTDQTVTQAFWASSSHAWQETALASSSPTTSMSLNDIACVQNTCTAVGSTDQQNATDGQALIATNQTGTWTSEVLPLPQGQALNAELLAISCWSETCVVGGDYNTSTSQQPFADIGWASTWSPSVLPPQPLSGQITALACASASTCVATGDESTSSGNTAVIQNAAPTLQLLTKGQITTRVGSSLRQVAAVQGGSGALHFALSKGQLPAGLSLNGNTGVISGRALKRGTSQFSVTVTCAGLPIQKVTETMKIVVLARSSS